MKPGILVRAKPALPQGRSRTYHKTINIFKETSRFALLTRRIITGFVLFVTCYLLLPHPADAADSTPSVQTQSKLEQLKLEIASKAAKFKKEVTKKLQNKAFSGIVKNKSINSFTLATKSGTKMVTTNQDTVFDPKKPPKEEDFIVALGDVDDAGVLVAKKIILLPASQRGEPAKNYKLKTIIWGQVISSSDNLYTVKQKDSKNIAISLKEVLEKPKTNDFIIVTGQIGKNEILDAGFLYIYPRHPPNGQVASPSARPATKSGTIK